MRQAGRPLMETVGPRTCLAYSNNGRNQISNIKPCPVSSALCVSYSSALLLSTTPPLLSADTLPGVAALGGASVWVWWPEEPINLHGHDDDDDWVSRARQSVSNRSLAASNNDPRGRRQPLILWSRSYRASIERVVEWPFDSAYK